MSQAEPFALSGVQKTLLLPLWGRAVESGKAHPLLVDPAAVAIVTALPYDFAAMARNLDPITRLSWIARSLHIDRTIRAFLDLHPAAAIVHLGCGLDTTFERVVNCQLHWFDLDLPDVTALRRRLVPEGERRAPLRARCWTMRGGVRSNLAIRFSLPPLAFSTISGKMR